MELSDDKGNVKGLRESPQRYASEILPDRDVFVLLTVEGEYDQFRIAFCFTI